MESGFNNPPLHEPSGTWEEVSGIVSTRYKFYKTRIYGRLHFVKTLSEEMQGDLISMEALRKEFAIGYALDHPSIIRYLKFDGNAIYEEYIDGKSLRMMLDEEDERLKDKRFIAKICRELLEAVEYMHSMGVLHLDIKPENVMITRVGNKVKIIDFGCAYTATDDTTQGFTLQYKAPEQGNGETNGFTDIYLIGKTIAELADKAGCLRRWEAFIRKATAGNPSDRFHTEAEAIKAIPGNRPKSRVVASAMVVMGVAVSLILLNINKEKAQQHDNAESVESVTIQPTDSITPSVQLEKDAELNKNIEVSKPQPTIDQRTLLERDITDYVSAYYLATIKPICPPDTITQETSGNLQRLMRQAIQRSQEFGDSLASEYPEYESMIQSKVHEVINAQQSQAGLWFYGPERSGIK